MGNVKKVSAEPAFGRGACAVCLAANDFYVPYLSVVLQSLRDNSSSGHCYDIWVLTTDIKKSHQKKLKKQMAADNISLRFLDVSDYVGQFRGIFTRGHFRIETYYRLLMQDLFTSYEKMLYLDSDIVIKRDVYQLFSQDIQGKLLAAVRDADTAGLYHGAIDGSGYQSKSDYMDNVLKIKEPYKYFQAGVILFNLDEFRKTFTVQEIIDFALSDDWQLLDQDVLNYLAQGQVSFLDYRWNVITDWKFMRIKTIISLAPEEMKRDYMASRKDPFIIHYAGPDKPWDYPRSDMAKDFWTVARKTPFFPIITKRMLSNEFAEKTGRKEK